MSHLSYIGDAVCIGKCMLTLELELLHVIMMVNQIHSTTIIDNNVFV